MTSIHEDTNIGYVKLTIRSLERSLQFYCNVIGFQVLKRRIAKPNYRLTENASCLFSKKIRAPSSCLNGL